MSDSPEILEVTQLRQQLAAVTQERDNLARENLQAFNQLATVTEQLRAVSIVSRQYVTWSDKQARKEAP